MNFISNKINPGILSAYLSTLNITTTNRPDTSMNCIYIFWHSKMLLGWRLFKNTGAAALVSQSKDGDILNGILTNWKYNVIRGSSSKGGKEALTRLIKSANSGHSIVITPDGPRGPASMIKNGAFIISNETGLPIVPISINFAKKKILTRSWDKFEIPYPFSKCSAIFGKKFYYEKYLDESGLQNLKELISKEMT